MIYKVVHEIDDEVFDEMEFDNNDDVIKYAYGTNFPVGERMIVNDRCQYGHDRCWRAYVT